MLAYHLLSREKIDQGVNFGTAKTKKCLHFICGVETKLIKGQNISYKKRIIENRPRFLQRSGSRESPVIISAQLSLNEPHRLHRYTRRIFRDEDLSSLTKSILAHL